MLNNIKQKYFSPTSIDNERANNFNIIRLVAAVMVVYGHMGHIIGANVFTIYNQAVSTIAVKIFFLISGYLITNSFFHDSNIIRYTLRRVFRIFPALIVVVLFSIFIVGPIFTTVSLSEYLKSPAIIDYLRNVFLRISYSLPGLFADNIYPNAVNGSFWTLPAEFSMYILLPILVLIFNKLKMLKPGLILIVFATLAVNIIKMIYHPNARLVIYGSNIMDWLTLIPFFFIGSVFTFPEIKKHLNLQWATAIAAIGSLISLNYVKSEILLAIVLPYFIFSFALSPKPVFANWFSKNDYSYGIYLYGFLIQQVYSHLIGAKYSLNISAVICTIVTFIFAFISCHLVEKPCQKLCKRITSSLFLKKGKNYVIKI